MKQKDKINDYLWIASEIFYYFGLLLAAFAVPALALSLWFMSLVDIVKPNFYYILIAWILSLLMFMLGILLKRRDENIEVNTKPD